jgi:hypothetical protein
MGTFSVSIINIKYKNRNESFGYADEMFMENKMFIEV